MPGPFDDAGTLRDAYANVDWAATSLGPVEDWSPALRNSVDVALNTRFPVTLLWGPEFVLVYNEAYVEMIADKHPAALGRPAQEIFPEAWDVIGPLMQGVRDGGGATWHENTYLPLSRNGYLEDCYFTYSYSPVTGEDGTVEGIIDIATETTAQMVIGRRLQLLTRLGDELASVERVEDVPGRALSVLRQNVADWSAVDVRVAGVPDPDRGAGLPDEPVAPLEGDLSLESTDDGLVAWLPLADEDSGLDALLVVQLSPRLPRDGDYLDFLRLVAAALTQALERVLIREAERTWSEALQRSLLARPASIGGLDLAVRYQPAAEVAQVGGDWYDAFRLPDGRLALVVGDVAGHDEHAAASMGQIRNLVRGVAYSRPESPASVLSGLDHAMHGLDVNVVATAVLAQLEPGGGPGGSRLSLRWSNAGHPPPVLLSADGTARLLETDPDLLLGLNVDAARTDHTLDLEPGSSLVIYTDGLVERRGAAIDAGLAWLVSAVEGQHGLTADELCDRLLGQLSGRSEDDVALLVMRASG
ncbi:SpoIIE family protein phosphatase [Nocardioides sp. MAHUQ-72]|uniref:SpoIIE family protein phosphatase n=1 Tax=unclassified Nocardioides TaxID=2615069 RepID=UPI00361180B9